MLETNRSLSLRLSLIRLVFEGWIVSAFLVGGADGGGGGLAKAGAIRVDA